MLDKVLVIYPDTVDFICITNGLIFPVKRWMVTLLPSFLALVLASTLEELELDGDKGSLDGSKGELSDNKSLLRLDSEEESSFWEDLRLAWESFPFVAHLVADFLSKKVL